MKIILLSDSHGYTENIFKLLEQALPAQYYLHAGDGNSDAQYLYTATSKPVYTVCGNCDPLDGYSPQERIIEIGSHKILLTHGHTFAIKNGYKYLFNYAEQLNANIIICGHTHIADIKLQNNILLVNPGSISLPKLSFNPTYAVLDLSTIKPKAEIKLL